MQVDVQADRSMIESMRRDGGRGPWLQVLSQVLDIAGGCAEFLRHTERPWASATFSGARHVIALAFTGLEAINAAETLIEALPDHEFSIHGHLVADAAITAVDHQAGEPPRLTLECELLLLKES